MKKILGISAYYHDSAAAIVIGGRIVAAAQEERFTRIKHCAEFPVHAIRYCLEEAGLSLEELDAVVFYDKPLLKFERLLQTYYAFAPKGLFSFLRAMPIWLKDKLFLKKRIRAELSKLEVFDRKKLKLLFSEHHLSHAASAFFASPYAQSAILTIDGVGEWCTASIALGKGNTIQILKEMEFPHSVGLLYSAFTHYLGFEVNGGEYKLMGLAPYGNPEAASTLSYMATIKSKMVDIKSDGSIWLDQRYFDYAAGSQMTNDKQWRSLFGMERRRADTQIEQEHCDLAFAIQQVIEEIVLKMAQEAKRITGLEHLCLAGGVALNCVANGKLLAAGIFEKLFVQPAAGDAGGSLGAAMAVSHLYYDEPRDPDGILDQMQGALLGPSYSEKEILQMNRKQNAACKKYEDFNDLCGWIAQKIAEGKVVGWFQERMEFGPRALGNRSILGDARNPKMQQVINEKIKFREGFRPFAPSVLEEDAAVLFKITQPSPYMLMVCDVTQNQRITLPEGYEAFGLREKLDTEKSVIPAVTHVDFSARIQMVGEHSNSRYYLLLRAFKERTGLGILINTSFNIKDEPIVCSPEDAYRCFMRTEMDYMVIGDFVYAKGEQPN